MAAQLASLGCLQSPGSHLPCPVSRAVLRLPSASAWCDRSTRITHNSRDVLRACLQAALGKETTRKGSKGDVAAGATVRVLNPASMK